MADWDRNNNNFDPDDWQSGMTGNNNEYGQNPDPNQWNGGPVNNEPWDTTPGYDGPGDELIDFGDQPNNQDTGSWGNVDNNTGWSEYQQPINTADNGWQNQNQGYENQNQGYENQGYETYENNQQSYGYSEEQNPNDQWDYGSMSGGYDYNEVDEPYENGKKRRKKKKKYKEPKGPRRGGCLISILKFFFILALIIALIVAAILGFSKYKQDKANKAEIAEIEASIVRQSYEDYIKYAVNNDRETDLQGFTVGEKIERGLSTLDGSDTDRDGISDKDEVEKYGTNPVAVSTSGDCIPDGFKIAKGLDINTKYNPEDVGFEAFTQFPNITFNDQTALNSLIGVQEMEYKIEGVPTIVTYKISSYDGTLDIDFNEFMEDGKKYKAFVQSTSADEKLTEVKLKKGIAHIELNGITHRVGLIEKMDKTTFNSTFDDEGGDDNTEAEAMTVDRKGRGLVIMYPITAISGEMTTFVLEESFLGSGKSDKSVALSSELTDKLGYKVAVQHQYYDSISYSIISSILKSLASGDFFLRSMEAGGADPNHESTQEAMSLVKRILSIFVMVYEFESYDWIDELNIPDKTEEEKPEEKEEKPDSMISTFRADRDGYCFPNMSTVITPGNCAGMAMSAVQMFNGKTITMTGKETDFFEDGTTYSYDLNGYDELKTLIDPGLYDYQTKNYWKDNYKELSTTELKSMAASDAKFIEYIGYKWAEANSKIERVVHFYASEEPWSSIEALFDYLESGDKTAYVGMLCPSGGHAILCYGAYQDPDDPDIYYLLVHDNNAPNNVLRGYKINNTIKIVKKTSWLGNETYEWDYYPLPSKAPTYRFSSYFTVDFSDGVNESSLVVNGFQGHGLTIADENFNLIR